MATSDSPILAKSLGTVLDFQQTLANKGLAAELATNTAKQAAAAIPALVTSATAPILTQAASAVSLAAALVGTLPQFRSNSTSAPRNPTADELTANPNGVYGSKLDGSNRVQLLTWNSGSSAWVAYGVPFASAADYNAALNAATTVQSALNRTQATLGSLSITAGRQFTELGRWLPSASVPTNGQPYVTATDGYWVLGESGFIWNGVRTIATGPAGVKEEDSGQVRVSGLRTERLTYGLGLNAAVQSASNVVGARTQVMGVTALNQVGAYGSLDHVTRFAEMVADPTLYSVVTGNATFTSNSVTPSGMTDAMWSVVRVGGFILTNHSPTPYYGVVTAFDKTAGTISVSGWYTFNSAATASLPAGGTPVRLNAATKVWGDNVNVILPSGTPVVNAAIAEYGMQNNSGSYKAGLGVDVVSLGSSPLNTALVARSSTAGGAWAQGLAVQGVSGVGVSVETLNGVSPVREFQAAANSQVGFYSSGTKTFHIQALGADLSPRFSVDNAGNALIAGALGVGGILDVQSGRLDLHTSGDTDFTVSLSAVNAGGNGQLWVTPINGTAARIGTQAAALTNPLSTTAAGAAPTQAEFNALQARFEELVTKMRASGLLG